MAHDWDAVDTLEDRAVSATRNLRGFGALVVVLGVLATIGLGIAGFSLTSNPEASGGGALLGWAVMVLASSLCSGSLLYGMAVIVEATARQVTEAKARAASELR